jgi:hypothetical protein
MLELLHAKAVHRPCWERTLQLHPKLMCRPMKERSETCPAVRYVGVYEVAGVERMSGPPQLTRTTGQGFRLSLVPAVIP